MVLITEEQAASHALDARGRFLIVDPLDGTKEFVQRRGDFTVNIAYVENGVPMRGVVYAPAQGRLFYTRADGVAVEETGALAKDTVGRAARDQGQHAGQRGADGGRLARATAIRRRMTTSRKYAVKDMKSAGSSLKFCLVATGEADLYPRLGRTMEWDTAAGDAVLRGAGGQVVRFDDHYAAGLWQGGLGQPVLHRLCARRGPEEMSVLIAIPARYASSPAIRASPW